MLEPTQVKSFILHPDKLISNAAVEYFSEGCLYDQELMPLLIERMQNTKSLEQLHLFYAEKFPQTNMTLEALFNFLENSTLHINTKFQIFKIISNSDLQLLEAFQHKLNLLPTGYQEQIEHRFQLSSMTTSTLWDQLRKLCLDATGKYVNEFNYGYGILIIQEMSKRSDLDPAEILSILNPANESYELEYGILLAGEKKLHEAIPALVNLLGHEGDLVTKNAVTALVRIGSSDVVSEIVCRFPKESWDFRLFASDVLSRLKQPESEKVILDLLPVEQDPTVATSLAYGLCTLLSVEGIPLVSHQIGQGYDRLVDLEESLYVNCIMNNVHLPELERYKHKIEQKEREQELLAREQENAKLGRKLQGVNPTNTNRFGLPSNVPYVAPEKVGRNDPCPCGSGKKYKKCCGA
ncbi:SEC-C metal-binding domain-containing protein [Paenibacillus azoreducens]|uniref:SEC-C metal-binding domain-containing protein n=1 Tax=Paenibacillus azoreducens TaxID=116718 RepID=UPI0039F4D282